MAVRVLRFAYTLFRSLGKGRKQCRATILPAKRGAYDDKRYAYGDSIYNKHDEDGDVVGVGAVQVRIKLSRLWNFRPGQYIYLCIPAISFGAWAQSHPYFVSWWYLDSDGDQVVVLIVESQTGFSKVLNSHCHKDDGPPEQWRALIEGPFGHEIHLDEYGTVLLVATGIGIAGQLPYIKQLLHGYSNHDIKARKVSLFWEVESECEYG
jgi:NAD(P)H-flavin reductase